MPPKPPRRTSNQNLRILGSKFLRVPWSHLQRALRHSLGRTRNCPAYRISQRVVAARAIGIMGVTAGGSGRKDKSNFGDNVPGEGPE